MGARERLEAHAASGTDEELLGALELAQVQIDEILGDESRGTADDPEYAGLCHVRSAVVAELDRRGVARP